jgi:predicted ATP-grasp superfamily ATP-dependent carboligase
MEWLPGPEVSIDILCWNGEPLIHAARVKASDNVQVIKSEHPMVEHARMLARKHKFHGIISVQYRLDANGDWKALEINGRPAGGCIHSEDAGFKIITMWTWLVLEVIRPEDVPQHHQFHGKKVVEFVRTPHIKDTDD